MPRPFQPSVFRFSLRSVLTTSEYHYFRFLVQLGTLSPPWPGFRPCRVHYLTNSSLFPTALLLAKTSTIMSRQLDSSLTNNTVTPVAKKIRSPAKVKQHPRNFAKQFSSHHDNDHLPPSPLPTLTSTYAPWVARDAFSSLRPPRSWYLGTLWNLQLTVFAQSIADAPNP